MSSAAAQADSDCEFVIVDGASEDETPEVVNRFRAAGHRVVYFRRDEAVGVDRDILKAVELASGTFCWLLSDDDRLEEGAYRHVVDAISRHPDTAGVSVNYAAYDRNLAHRVRTVPAISGGRFKHDLSLTDREECFKLLGLHLGFISAQVIHRETWQLAVHGQDVEPFCNSWIIVYVVGEMLKRNPKWLYLHRECIAYRSGNDSFAKRVGVYRRQLIAHEAYASTLAALFGRRSRTYTRVLRTLVADRMPRTLAMIKADGASVRLQFDLLVLYLRKYWAYPMFWLKVAPLFLVPNPVFRSVRSLYFRLRTV